MTEIPGVSRPAALRFTLPCDLKQVRQAAQTVHHFLAEQGCDEQTLSACDLALVEACNNAIKYAPEGGTVSLQCRKQGDQYVVSVSDNGPGIPADMQHRIFERFFRVDKSRSRSEGDTGGAGLGLSIARLIAEAHHGRLELTRSDSSGSTFTAFLPVSTSLC